MNRGLLLFLILFISLNSILYWLAGGILGEKEAPPIKEFESEAQPIIKANIGKQSLQFYAQHNIRGGKYYHYDEKDTKIAEIEFGAIMPHRLQEARLNLPIAKYWRVGQSNKQFDVPKYFVITGHSGILKFSDEATKIESIILNNDLDESLQPNILALISLGFYSITNPPIIIEGFDSESSSTILSQLTTSKLDFSFEKKLLTNDCFNHLYHFNSQGNLLFMIEGIGLQGDCNLEQVELLNQVRIKFASQLWQRSFQSASQLPIEYWTSQSKGTTKVRYDRQNREIYISQCEDVILSSSQSELRCQKLELWLINTPDSLKPTQDNWQLKKLVASGNISFYDGKPIVRNFIQAGLCTMQRNEQGEISLVFQNNPKIEINDILGFSLMTEESRKKFAREQKRHGWQKLESRCSDSLECHRIINNKNNFQEKFIFIGQVHLKQISRKIPLLELEAQKVEVLLESGEKTNSRVARFLNANKQVILKHDRGMASGDCLQWQQFDTSYLWKTMINDLELFTYLVKRKNQVKDISYQDPWNSNHFYEFIKNNTSLQSLFWDFAFQKKLENCYWLGISGNPKVWLNNIEVGNVAWQDELIPSPNQKEVKKQDNIKKENLYIVSKEPLLVISRKTSKGRIDIYSGKKDVEIIRQNQQQQEIGRMSCQFLQAKVLHEKKTKQKSIVKSNSKPQLQELFAKGNVKFTGPEANGGGEVLRLKITPEKHELFQLIGNAWTKNNQGSLTGQQFNYDKTTRDFIVYGNPVQINSSDFGGEGQILKYHQQEELIEIIGNLAQIWQPEETYPQLLKPTKKHQLFAQHIKYWRNSNQAEAKGKVNLIISQDQNMKALSIFNTENKDNFDENEKKVNQVIKKYQLLADELLAKFDVNKKSIYSVIAHGQNMQLRKIAPENGIMEKMQGNYLKYTPEYTEWAGKPAIIFYDKNKIISDKFVFLSNEKKVVGQGPCQAYLVSFKQENNAIQKPDLDKTPTLLNATGANLFGNQKEPIAIQTKGDMIFWQTQNQIELLQKVSIHSSQADLKCERLRVFLQDQKVTRILADGKVVLSSQDNIAYSEQLRWNQAEDVALLVGLPEVTLKSKDFTLRTPIAWYHISQRRFFTRGKNILLETQPKTHDKK